MYSIVLSSHGRQLALFAFTQACRSCCVNSDVVAVEYKGMYPKLLILVLSGSLLSQFENSELSDEDDQSSLAAATTNADDMLSVATRRCIYHVVYSSSYRVPVLYFNMYSLGKYLLVLRVAVYLK